MRFLLVRSRRAFMLRRIPSLLLAALVASVSVQAAQTRSGGQATAPAGGRAAAPASGRSTTPATAAAKPVPVTPADMAPMIGTWTIPLETPTGRLVANLVFRVEAGKVVA